MRNFLNEIVKNVGLDRMAHCAACAFLTVVAAMAAEGGEHNVPSLTLAVVMAGLTMVAGLANEYCDSAPEGDFIDWGALAADAVGCVLGGLTVWWLM